MSGFVWCKHIGKAKLAAGKATQLYNESLELKAVLDQRREWARAVIMLNPDLAPILRPEIPNTHRFAKFKREFEFNYYAEDNVWMLRFVRSLKDPPSADGANANGQGNAGGAPNGGPGPNADDGSSRASLAELWQDIVPLLEGRRHWLQDRRYRLDQELRFYREWVEDASAHTAERAREVTSALMADIRARLEAVRRDLFSAQSGNVFGEARLERRLIQIGPGLSVAINTFVYDRLPWENFLFGRLIEEEFLLD